MALQEYLAGEIAEDCADGLITRREALRRLGMLGLTLSSASMLVAACSDDDGDAATATTRSGATTSSPASAAGTAIRFAGPAGELQAAWAEADDPKAALLVIHENRGLTPHFHDLVGRFAKEGYSALCVDLVSAEGGTASMTDPAGAQAALGAASQDRLLADLRAGIGELARRAPNKKIGAVGFCFGGGMTWALLDAGEARLAAAAPFYGPAPDSPDFSRAKAAVLGVYGELDARVNASAAAGGSRAQGGWADLRDPHVRRSRPRVLQRHRRALQRGGRRRSEHRAARVVREVLGVAPRTLPTVPEREDVAHQVGRGMDADILRRQLDPSGVGEARSSTSKWRGRSRHVGVLLYRRGLAVLERLGVRGRVNSAVCGWKGAEFRPVLEGEWFQRNVCCPSCQSVQRHRLVALALADGLPSVSPVLWTAPESCLAPLIEQRWGGAITVDIEMPGVDVHADLEAIPLANGQLGAVVSVDVLEHVIDDRKVLGEFARTLGPDGFVLLHIPMLWSETVEYGFADLSDHGHRRGYGPDAVGRFTDAGFDVQAVHARDWSPLDRRRLGLLDWDVVFVLRPRR